MNYLNAVLIVETEVLPDYRVSRKDRLVGMKVNFFVLERFYRRLTKVLPLQQRFSIHAYTDAMLLSPLFSQFVVELSWQEGTQKATL